LISVQPNFWISSKTLSAVICRISTLAQAIHEVIVDAGSAAERPEFTCGAGFAHRQ
jgi:hypothetical protein